MIEALEKEGNSTRQDAAIALSRLGSPAVPALIEALRNENSYIRLNAAMALGRIGSEAATAVSALVEACQDPVPEVRGMGYPTHRHP